MAGIRTNPPDSIVTTEQRMKYCCLYDDLTENGVLLQYQDRYALAELATLHCEANALRKDLRDNGEWLKVQGDRNIIHKKNPARDALEKLRPHIFKLMKEFKMTPVSRGKNQGVVENQGDNDDGFGRI